MPEVQKLNVVILGGFAYPEGMAATKYIQLAIDGIKADPDVAVHVVILRQLTAENVPSGTHRGVAYETVMVDALRAKAVLLAPLLHHRARRTMARLFQPDRRNVLYIYGPPSPENLPTIRYARRCGYQIVFCIVEDDDFAFEESRGLWHRLKTRFIQRAIAALPSVADGVVAISSHLMRKYRQPPYASLALQYIPILIDPAQYPQSPRPLGESVRLFYSGTFNVKDGVPVLLDAFEKLAAVHAGVRLVLTGKGIDEVMRPVLARIQASAFRDRIDYKGYLDDEAYRAALGAADIPCMTRVDTGFANAGFPFKLGEFLTTGKPVVASRVSDVEQILADRCEAMLVRPGSSDDIVAAVEHLIANPAEAAAIGARGREKAIRHFDYGARGRELLDFFRRLPARSTK